MKYKDSSHFKVDGATAKLLRYKTPTYAYSRFKTHELNSKSLLNVDIKDMHRYAFYNLLSQWFPTGEEFLPREEFHELRGGFSTS